MTKTVRYIVHYKYYGCYDDGYQWAHDQIWYDGTKEIEASTDKEARLIWLTNPEAEWRKPSYCGSCGRPKAYTVKLEKIVHEETEDGFERTTSSDVPLPASRKCPCGKEFWPIKDEQACHELVVTTHD